MLATLVAETATGLRRGLAILVALEAADGKGLSVTRIAELVGREKSQISRTLKVLGEFGFVDRDQDTLAYRIGWRVYTLAGQAAKPHLLEAAAPVLARLVRDLGETAHLSLLSGNEVMTVLSEAPNRAVLAAGWVGRTSPVHCTSSGRALLLDHDLADLTELLDEIAFDGPGPNAPRTLDELFERIRAARARGFAVVEEELEPGLVAAGAPVRDFSGRIVAAVNVSAPKFRFVAHLETAGEAVKAAAAELSQHLGARERHSASA